MTRTASCLAALSLALMGAPAFAADAREIEVFDFTHRIDFTNEPVGNRFVIAKTGEIRRHPVLQTSAARRFLQELQVTSTDLERAQMGGREVPVELIKAQAPGLFGKASRSFAIESFDLNTPRFDDLGRVERALTQQYEDHILVETLAHLCERDWARIKKHAASTSNRSTAFASWTVPDLYTALTYAETRAEDGRRQITIHGSGVGPASGTGARQLDGFRFEGQLDATTGRFAQIQVTGTVRNIVKKIKLKLTYTRTLKRVDAVTGDATPDYDRAATGIARAVHLAARRLRSEAVKAYESLKGGGVERFRESAEEFFAKVRKAAQGVVWDHKDLGSALTDATAVGKPILLLFDQDGCPTCTLLERGVLTAPSFVSAVEGNFVTLRLNACTDRDVAKRFKLLGTPTLILLRPDGTEISRQVGARSLGSGLRLLRTGVTAEIAPAVKVKKFF
jgi:hypothetical protein